MSCPLVISSRSGSVTVKSSVKATSTPPDRCATPPGSRRFPGPRVVLHPLGASNPTEYRLGPCSDRRGQQNAAQFDYRKSAVSSHERLSPHCPTNMLNARILKAGLPRHEIDS